MIDVERALAELGDRLQLDDDVVAGVIADIEAPDGSAGSRSTLLKVAAIVAIVVAAAVALVPSTRDAVADWFGLDRVRIDRRDDVELVPMPTTVADSAPPASPIGETTEIVDGETVLIARFDGSLTDVLITKTVQATAAVVALDIDGDAALWIADPHEVLIERAGEVVVERVAANTLLWQDGDVLWRMEGFQRMEDAVRYARSRDAFSSPIG